MTDTTTTAPPGYTSHLATHPTYPVTLAGCGITLDVKQLGQGDHYDALDRYARLVQSLTMMLGRAPQPKDIREHIHDVLKTTYGFFDLTELADGTLAPARLGQQTALDFLAYFLVALPEQPQPTAEEVAAEFGMTVEDITDLQQRGWTIPPVTVCDLMTPDDWLDLWTAIYEVNRYPFAFRLQQMRMKGEIDEALQFTTTAPTSPSSSAPDSTPATPPSPSSTARPSRKRKPNTK